MRYYFNYYGVNCDDSDILPDADNIADAFYYAVEYLRDVLTTDEINALEWVEIVKHNADGWIIATWEVSNLIKRICNGENVTGAEIRAQLRGAKR